jgi:hypothetical protein
LAGWSESTDYPGLIERTENGKTTYALPEYYLHYEDIMIPWDARVFNRDEKFTRQRTSYNKDRTDLYVYSDGLYTTLDDYYKNNGFTGRLSYDGLKVSFIKDFKYNATGFSITDIPEDRQEYL